MEKRWAGWKLGLTRQHQEHNPGYHCQHQVNGQENAVAGGIRTLPESVKNPIPLEKGSCMESRKFPPR